MDVCTDVRQITNPFIIEHPDDQYVVRNEPATLNCKAEGQPTPSITWYRNGQPVVTANEDPTVDRMLLPSGQLFFLRVLAPGKAGRSASAASDVGIYYCNATNQETGFSVISRNASLDLAGKHCSITMTTRHSLMRQLHVCQRSCEFTFQAFLQPVQHRSSIEHCYNVSVLALV